MLERFERHPYASLWVGFLLAAAALLCNFLLFVNPPQPQLVPWLSLLLAAVAIIPVTAGLVNIFRRRKAALGKTLGSMLALISLLLAAASTLAFFEARSVPASAGAPKIGNRAPDFTLPDTSGQQISLDQLLAPLASDPQAAPPKAVLLVFYRGYW